MTAVTLFKCRSVIPCWARKQAIKTSHRAITHKATMAKGEQHLERQPHVSGSSIGLQLRLLEGYISSAQQARVTQGFGIQNLYPE